jgi:Fe/S biogenesis protein NfuA
MDDERPILRVTEPARSSILEMRAAEADAEGLALRVEVTGSAGAEYAYDLTFQALEGAAAGDVLYDQDGLPVIIPADSVRRLEGSVLDLPAEGLVLRNPNRPSPFGPTEDLRLEGDVAERIQRLLDEQINPGLAGHGGHAALVHVEGDTAHLLMGGGCQGCGLAQATLTAGIEAAIVDAVPEIRRVVDVTDHAAGENPYYAST